MALQRLARSNVTNAYIGIRRAVYSTGKPSQRNASIYRRQTRAFTIFRNSDAAMAGWAPERTGHSRTVRNYLK